MTWGASASTMSAEAGVATWALVTSSGSSLVKGPREEPPPGGLSTLLLFRPSGLIPENIRVELAIFYREQTRSFSHKMQKYKNLKHLVVWAGGRLTSLCAGSLCAGNQLLFVTNSTYLTAVLCRAEAGRGLTELTAPPWPGLKNPETLSVGRTGAGLCQLSQALFPSWQDGT